MIITEILKENAKKYGNEIALIERSPETGNRRTITWKEFDKMANRIANALIAMGVKKGDKVIHLMMNCLEWLPAYFGILKTGAWAVPLNFRFTAKDIILCSDIAEGSVIIFGEEFVNRINKLKEEDWRIKNYVFLGPDDEKPVYTESFHDIIEKSSDEAPDIPINISDEAALYFTSGTTGTPKPILLTHRNLEAACVTENRHHVQTHSDNFLCIPPLYHTGAKMHWFGNFIVGARSVLLKGVRPEWILKTISEEQITIVFLLVPWIQDILVGIENGTFNKDDYEIDQCRLLHSGAPACSSGP